MTGVVEIFEFLLVKLFSVILNQTYFNNFQGQRLILTVETKV